MNIYDLLDQLISLDGSDLHIIPGTEPYFRIDSELRPVESTPVLTPKQCEALIEPLLTDEQLEYLEVNKELDFGYQFVDKGRFRINVYHAKGNLAAALRLIPAEIRSIEELNLPEEYHKFSKWKQGFVLMTGPTGTGKSSTLTEIIDEINEKRAEHIVTIEDPIEFVHESKKSIISQREVGNDTKDWKIALKSCLREDPDVILVGEMRDWETMAAALTAAETGHLVFATLHTNSVPQTINRIIDVFPSHQQEQIRQQLAATIKAVASQRLMMRIQGGLIPAVELLFANDAIRNLIRESKVHQIDTVIQTSGAEGMMLIEKHLLQLIQKGLIEEEDALNTAFRPKEMKRMLNEA